MRIVYGYPDPELAEKADRGEIVLGGCILDEKAPRFACACGHRFGAIGASKAPGGAAVPDASLPFFAYGIFKVGQLGFLALRDSVATVDRDCTVKGRLRERDGLVLLDENGRDRVSGALLDFAADRGANAYANITAIEPEHQYRWVLADVETKTGKRRGNVLVGRSPERGSAPLDDPNWDGRLDPLFTTALDVVGETYAASLTFDWDLKPLFRLQMAYLLLWSAIERYTALRYGLGSGVSQRVNRLADEIAFQDGLRRLPPRDKPMEVVRTDDPTKKKVRFDPDDAAGSVEYLYQVRSNIAHRGKAVVQDHERVSHALGVLLPIFKEVLGAAFDDAGRVHDR